MGPNCIFFLRFIKINQAFIVLGTLNESESVYKMRCRFVCTKKFNNKSHTPYKSVYWICAPAHIIIGFRRYPNRFPDTNRVRTDMVIDFLKTYWIRLSIFHIRKNLYVYMRGRLLTIDKHTVRQTKILHAT